MTDSPTSLEDAMDAFAQNLLEKGRESANLAEAMKVFETVGRYLEQRAKALPSAPPAEDTKKGSRFADIKQRFNGSDGHAPARRTRRTAASATDDPAGTA